MTFGWDISPTLFPPSFPPKKARNGFLQTDRSLQIDLRTRMFGTEDHKMATIENEP